MRKSDNTSLDGVFITIQMASQLTNLGTTTVRRLARDCHASRKIGRAYRIRKDILLQYIDSFEE